MICNLCGRDIKSHAKGDVFCLCSGTPNKLGTSKKNTIKKNNRKDKFAFLYKRKEGAEHWGKLHKYSVTHKNKWNSKEAQKWFESWERSIPNINCSCRRHWFENKQKLPPDFTSAESFFKWSVEIHNVVNKQLDKPILSYQEAREIHGF